MSTSSTQAPRISISVDWSCPKNSDTWFYAA
jgi:hypothetical protein